MVCLVGSNDIIMSKKILFKYLLNHSSTLSYPGNFGTFVLYVIRKLFQFPFLIKVQEPQSKTQINIIVL